METLHKIIHATIAIQQYQTVIIVQILQNVNSLFTT